MALQADLDRDVASKSSSRRRRCAAPPPGAAARSGVTAGGQRLLAFENRRSSWVMLRGPNGSSTPWGVHRAAGRLRRPAGGESTRDPLSCFIARRTAERNCRGAACHVVASARRLQVPTRSAGSSSQVVQRSSACHAGAPRRHPPTPGSRAVRAESTTPTCRFATARSPTGRTGHSRAGRHSKARTGIDGDRRRDGRCSTRAQATVNGGRATPGQHQRRRDRRPAAQARRAGGAGAAPNPSSCSRRVRQLLRQRARVVAAGSAGGPEASVTPGQPVPTEERGFGSVALDLTLPGARPGRAQRLVEAAHRVWPVLQRTRGNSTSR